MSKPLFATLLGFSAVLMWSFLALFTAMSGSVPPLQLTAMCFAIGTVIGFAWVAKTGAWAALRQPAYIWAFTTLGLFGYHFLYFTALRNAPEVEAGLIAYLWPLLIVVLSALLPGERLRWYHVAGALMGLAGSVLIITGGKGLTIEARFAFGYSIALLCALTWSSYSVLSRRFHTVPTAFIAAICGLTALLSAIAHLTLETTVWPATNTQWLAVLGLGLFPVGAAFYVWDYGVKHGHIQIIGVASYAAPLLSTLILIAAGFADASSNLLLACGLIAGGALLAAVPTLRKGENNHSADDHRHKQY